MRTSSAVLVRFMVLVSFRPCQAATRYVWTNSPSPGNGYLSWDTAAHTIQEAVDAAASNDTVLVTNGVYATGGAAVYGTMSNRVAITNSIAVRSVSGPDVTFIVGRGPLGTNAIRCAYLAKDACLVGFTLSNGFTRYQFPFDDVQERSGGGVWCRDNGTVSNCVIVGSAADWHGGGVFCFNGGRLVNSIVSGNSAFGGAGVTCLSNGTAQGCSILGNKTTGCSGGGALLDSGGTIQGCTIISNKAIGLESGGGGIDFKGEGGKVEGCTISGNVADGGGGVLFQGSGTVFKCTIVCNEGAVGGGVEFDSSGSVQECTIAGNHANGTLGGGASTATRVGRLLRNVA